MNKEKKIRVLLVGAGHFGGKHLRVLKQLEGEGALVIHGVVVKSEATRSRIAREFGVPVFTELSPALLRGVDVVDIVTPSPNHFAAIRKCLPFAHVLAEKPLAMNARDAASLVRLAKRHKKILMVGHVFRFHPLLKELQKYLSKAGRIEKIESSFISPIKTDTGLPATLELLHPFDLLDAIYKKIPSVIWSRETGRVTHVDLRYGENLNVSLEIGWQGERKERLLTFYPQAGDMKGIIADFDLWELRIEYRDGTRKKVSVSGKEPLAEELRCFLDVVQGEKRAFPDGNIGARIVSVAERAIAKPKKTRIAIVGGGMFGMTAAAVLGEKWSVTVFERRNDILAEASCANQYRHHRGYHYPRSPETIRQIKESTADFEKMYGKAIVEIPSYIAVARKDSKVTAAEFRRMCRDNRLQYKEEYPPEGFLDRSKVSMCIKTNEAVYDYEGLKRVIRENIGKGKARVRLGAEVKKITIADTGEKIVAWSSRGKLRQEAFDYVINATYANYNTVARMLGFPARELEYRFKEIEVIRIKGHAPAAVMVVDGPFATIVPIGKSDFYTFGDVPLSVRRKTPVYSDRAFEAWKRSAKSKALQMMKRSRQWLPILDKATHVKSIFVTLPIDASSRKNDDRVTSLTYHGFGCFSVLEGKIITSVSVARKLLAEIEMFEEKGK